MKAKYSADRLYRRIYSALRCTPAAFDCGKLCGGACCQDSEHGTGMYLYPGEEAMFSSSREWAKIEDSDFLCAGRAVKILSCPGKCNRSLRPLACRLFPLVPYMKSDGGIKIIFDPRAAAFCPLRKTGVLASFKHHVEKCVNILKKTECGRTFIKEQSSLIDDYVEITGKFIRKKGIEK